MSRSREGKRQYLKDSMTRCMMKELDKRFLTRVEIPLIRQGKKQRIVTLINERHYC